MVYFVIPFHLTRTNKPSVRPFKKKKKVLSFVLPSIDCDGGSEYTYSTSVSVHQVSPCRRPHFQFININRPMLLLLCCFSAELFLLLLHLSAPLSTLCSCCYECRIEFYLFLYVARLDFVWYIQSAACWVWRNPICCRRNALVNKVNSSDVGHLFSFHSIPSPIVIIFVYFVLASACSSSRLLGRPSLFFNSARLLIGFRKNEGKKKA